MSEPLSSGPMPSSGAAAMNRATPRSDAAASSRSSASAAPPRQRSAHSALCASSQAATCKGHTRL